jgi:hypothetical protein
MSGRSTAIAAQLNQDAVYWGSPANDGYGGLTFADPVQIHVRWEDKQVMFVDASGKDMLSQAVVYVDRALEIDGYLYLGTLDDLSSGELVNPLLVAEAYPVRGRSSSPDFRAQKFVRKVWLRRS